MKNATKNTTTHIGELPPITVFTVGDEKRYDQGLSEPGNRLRKTGRLPGYQGGFVVRTAEDAERLIDERGKRGVEAVYALDADWDRDTVPSESGWWHALLKSSRVIQKVPSPAK